MKPTQVVLEKRFVRTADRVARRTKQNPSDSVCEALWAEMQALEDRDHKGYLQQPQMHDECSLWEAEAAWPAK